MGRVPHGEYCGEYEMRNRMVCLVHLNRAFKVWLILSLSLLPVMATGMVGEGGGASGKNGIVAAAHPLASEAAIEMFRRGGNAVDAAVAAAFAISVVEPDGSGLGGGGGMLIYLGKQQKAVYINYYQRAGQRVRDVQYEPSKDRLSAKAVLVPGTVDALTRALKDYGSLPLPVVLGPAIRYAEEGFAIDQTLGKIILDHVDLLMKDPATAEVYIPDGFPLVEGQTLSQPQLGKTLRAIAERGRAGFYEGPVAEAIVEGIVRGRGIITLEDLRDFNSQVLEPVRGTYRGYDIVSASPPQAGASIIQALNMLEFEDVGKIGHFAESVKSLHLAVEVMRRVYADRSAHLADPRFEQIPLKGLLSKQYARSRFDEIDRTKPVPREYRQTKEGNPSPFDEANSQIPVRKGERYADAPAFPLHRAVQGIPYSRGNQREDQLDRLTEADGGHTTHLSVMDGEGNVVSLTQTLGTFFGSGLTIAGVLMNNARTNFSESTRRNFLEPGKQPRSSIAPTIVLRNGRPFMAVGSPGAARIVATVVQVISNIVDFGMNVDDANLAPRFFCQKLDDNLHVESRTDPKVIEVLKTMGHQIEVHGEFDLFFGGVQVTLFDAATGTYHGSADIRRGGMAVGF